jgi:choline dehydrogenase-like flavoprotein
VRLSPALEARESFEQGIRDGWGGGHQMGTTRMSAAASEGVVDAHGRVHGVSNLYCAGSSVFPTGGWMNPTLTIVALALRLADHLRAQLRERGSA